MTNMQEKTKTRPIFSDDVVTVADIERAEYQLHNLGVLKKVDQIRLIEAAKLAFKQSDTETLLRLAMSLVEHHLSDNDDRGIAARKIFNEIKTKRPDLIDNVSQ
jgi:hypothetical protein